MVHVAYPGGGLDQNPPIGSVIFQIFGGVFDQLYLRSEIMKKGMFLQVYH